MVYRLELIKNEIMKIHDLEYLPYSTTGYTLPNGIYENRNFFYVTIFVTH